MQGFLIYFSPSWLQMFLSEISDWVTVISTETYRETETHLLKNWKFTFSFLFFFVYFRFRHSSPIFCLRIVCKLPSREILLSKAWHVARLLNLETCVLEHSPLKKCRGSAMYLQNQPEIALFVVHKAKNLPRTSFIHSIELEKSIFWSDDLTDKAKIVVKRRQDN